MQIFAGINFLKVFPIRIDHTNCEKRNCNSAEVDNFSKLYVLVYVLDEWILFTVFCSMFSEPQCLDVIFDTKDIWPVATSVLMWPIVSGKLKLDFKQEKQVISGPGDDHLKSS